MEPNRNQQVNEQDLLDVTANGSGLKDSVQDGIRRVDVTYVSQIFWEILALLYNIFLVFCETLFRLVVPVPEKSVTGEIVLITGAGHGIGKELALQYADLDAIVVCWDINEQANNNTVSKIRKNGKSAYGYVCDVTNRTQVITTVEKIQREIGDISILINNAGILLGRSLLTHSEEDIRRTIDVNCTSHFWILQSVLPSMIHNNHGHIVALSSMVGLNGISNLIPYCSSKFAVRGIMSGLRDELRCNSKNQIQLTTILPAPVDTGLCKTLVIRYPNMFKEISPKCAAQSIISAQRRNIIEESIPKHLLYSYPISLMLPPQINDLVLDFVGIYFKSDK